MLQATHKSSFPHKGSERHVYTVTGTPEELAEFKKNQGSFYTEDKEDNTPLFFTNFRSIMDTAPLKLSKSGNYNFDEKDMNNVISKANSIGGVVGQAIGNQIANALIPDKIKQVIAKANGTQIDMFSAEKQDKAQSADDLGEY